MKRIIGFLFLAIVVFLVVLAFIYRSTVGDFLYFARKEPLPAPLAAKDIKKQNSQTAPLVPSGAEGLPIIKDQAEEVAGPVPSAVEEPQVQEWEKANEAKMPLLAEINLAVPFTSQAPFTNWDLPYKESCEEASVLMLDYFYRGASLNPALANQEILKIVDWQKIKFGAYEDTDAAQTAQILRDYFGYKNVRVSYDISIEDIKKELALGRPVIVPAAGQLLPNPFFRQPGPLYHMLVIKGYKDGKFITNDPGTRRGADFLYSYEGLYNAIHDWNAGNVYAGRKAMIVAEN